MKIANTSFFDKINRAFDRKLPFASYRRPEKDEIKGFFQKNDELRYTNNYSESGFVFAPFDNAEASILLPFNESEICTCSMSDMNISDVNLNNVVQSDSLDEEIKHVELVQKGINYLRSSNVKKIVLSRKKILTYSHLNVVETFKKLILEYPNAMIYIWFHPEIGLWLGATPETLLKVRNDSFSTMSLAGTQLYPGSLDVVWQDKEQEEQQYVTDYILDKLAKGKSKLTHTKPQTIKAGNLIHLCTTITGSLSPALTINKLIKLLHPTPAVCGLPEAEAKKFILENEGYDREFYTGFLGELNLNGTSNLYVNLRCMKVFEKQLALYIGGGITLDSNPKKEWEETLAKSKVILNVLN